MPVRCGKSLTFPACCHKFRYITALGTAKVASSFAWRLAPKAPIAQYGVTRLELPADAR
ncbi:protein of unknown function [Methylocaldum szegediense]|uniref:Uncharacterized protein n=1 Tax=Methylocaldum szegediense TaxID=73780 RepID=A0ABM9I6T0_9GAMM|nr:protein of unknown function [Methylocaldum szegediense]